MPAAVAPWAGEAELGDLLASYHRATQREKGEAELTDRYRKEIRDPAGAFAGDTVLVAWHGGAAVGCVVLTAPVAGEAELKRLWVDPAARGRGVASALTRAALARAEGAAVRLTVWGWRTGARALYERLGFAQVTSWDGRDGLVCMRRPGGPGGPGGALSGPASVPPV
ncbi:GNAT family N-acetyltransferase [Streptomyces sp. NBC_01803]|nr:GNAT family N-acetyltransferase [Streptomyces sp. NBC_01803]WSA47686.1 GNAT family N-acetyltransferase [Streptomyces sp. NBC_01803]